MRYNLVFRKKYNTAVLCEKVWYRVRLTYSLPLLTNDCSAYRFSTWELTDIHRARDCGRAFLFTCLSVCLSVCFIVHPGKPTSADCSSAFYLHLFWMRSWNELFYGLHVTSPRVVFCGLVASSTPHSRHNTDQCGQRPRLIDAHHSYGEHGNVSQWIQLNGCQENEAILSVSDGELLLHSERFQK